MPGVERLVSCDKFVLDRIRVRGSHGAGGDRRCHILAVLEGEVGVAGDPLDGPLARGAVVLLPAELGNTELLSPSGAVVLDAYLP